MRLVHVPKENFRLRPQIRHHGEDYLRRLAVSLLQGQLEPVGILRDGTTIWGKGRVVAARSTTTGPT